MIPDIARFQALVRERCGLLFEGGELVKLARAINERSSTVAATTTAYFALLERDPDEFQQLVNLLTINETYFLRESEQIEFLVEHLAPRLLGARAGGQPLRILSAGCSSGEEPYSLAIALHEKYGTSARHLFEILGGDIDSEVLARARQGRFTKYAFRAMPERLRDRYFTADGMHYVLHPEIGRQVSFHPLNLLTDDYPQALQNVDIVLFRNVSIYFDEPTRRTILQRLADTLNPQGILLVGMAETLANDFGVLPLVEEAGLFYFARQAPVTPLRQAAIPQTPHPAQMPRAVHAPAMPTANQSVPSASTFGMGHASLASAACRPAPAVVPAASIDEVLALVEEHRYDEALARLEQRLTANAGDSDARLLKAHIQIERKDFAAAETTLQPVLEHDPWSVDALLLLGLAAKWRGLAEAAQQHFKQAVYACNESWPAHYYLADLHRNTGATDLAQREYRIVLQLLAGQTPKTGLRRIPANLPVGQVRFLCEHQIGKLESSPRRMAR